MQTEPTTPTSPVSITSTKKKITPEDIFKYVNLAVTFILLFCVKGFLEFRSYSQNKGYYVFAVDSLIWVAVGFTFVFVKI
jgi:hypothetical protein